MDLRAQGHAMRRRHGAPSSHLAMADMAAGLADWDTAAAQVDPSLMGASLTPGQVPLPAVLTRQVTR